MNDWIKGLIALGAAVAIPAVLNRMQTAALPQVMPAPQPVAAGYTDAEKIAALQEEIKDMKNGGGERIVNAAIKGRRKRDTIQTALIAIAGSVAAPILASTLPGASDVIIEVCTALIKP